jgi:signal transduction histidine kinase
VLLVQDAAAGKDILCGCFDDVREGARDVVVERVGRLACARGRLAADRFDVVLLDLALPDASGLEGVDLLGAAAPDVPIIVIIEPADEPLAMAAVKAGAQDYLTNGQDSGRVVRHALRHAIERHRLRCEREALLTREREARAEAERAARVRDEVLAMVSHDLRSPLSAIAMSANGLLDASGDPRVLASAIAQSSQWALRIIRDLLDVTAIEAGRLAIHREPMTVLAIAEMIWSLFAAPASAAGVTLEVERAGAPLWVEADVDRVVQAVGNLVDNAIKFTPSGGRVALTVRQSGDAVRFRVEDSGPGIPPENIPRLFDRFWQAHETGRRGVGLGLVIAQGIARGHGGSIEVESRLGYGTAFTLVLPEQL